MKISLPTEVTIIMFTQIGYHCQIVNQYISIINVKPAYWLVNIFELNKNRSEYCVIILSFVLGKSYYCQATLIILYFLTDYMGAYSSLPQRPKISFNPHSHQFESQNVQRMKQTPFISSEVYSTDPPLFIDPIDIRLKQLIEPRISSHQLFPPTEILKLLQNIINALYELQSHGFISHGDVTTQSIYYDKKTKLFKLRHPLFSPESGYKLSKQSKRFSFLSPQQLLSLTDPQGSVQDQTTIKSDLFTFGIVMCEVCTLLPSNQIFCPQTYVIFDKQIQNRIQIIKQYYGSDPLLFDRIIKIILNLLQYDEGKRKSCKQLLWEFEEFERIDNSLMQPAKSRTEGLSFIPNIRTK